MSSKNSIELQLDGDDITLDRFWALTDDLLYTKVFYDTDTKLYFTKHYKNSYTEKASTEEDNSEDDAVPKEDDQDDSKDTSSDDYDLEICTEDEINTLLVSFITLVAKYCDTLIAQVGEDSFFDSIAEYLMNFKYYQTHVEFCIRKMLSLLIYSVDLNLHNLNLNVDALDDIVKDEINESIDTNEKFIKIIGWIFYKHYVHYKKELLETLQEYRGFTTLSKVLKNYIAISKTVEDGTDMFGNSYKNYMFLMFELCKNYDFSDELDIFEENDIVSLFEKLKVQPRDENEVNFLKFRLLLVLNEQYMFQCGLKVKNGDKVNYVFQAMIEKIQYFQVFNEILILNFNRELDRVDQILMLKFLYTVFSNSVTNNLVYLNDLKVIVDIIIRQLFNLQIGKSEYLVNIYLRVLYCILTETELKNHPYKKDELTEVLEYTSSSDDSVEKTKILAKRCIDCTYFHDPQNSAETLPALSSLQLKHGDDSSSERYLSCPESTAKDRLLKLGHDTQAFLSPAAKLLSLESHIIQQVTRSPTGHHIISPHRVAHRLHLDNGKIPFLDHLNMSSTHTNYANSSHHSPGRSATPPPPPPRITVAQRQRSPLSPLSSGGVDHSPSASLLQPQPPPPPPSRPYIRSQNVSANDVTTLSQKPAPPPPVCRKAARHGSFGTGASNTTTNTSGSESPTPPPPPPPPPSRRQGPNPSSSDPELHRYYGHSRNSAPHGLNHSDPSIHGLSKTDRTVSVLSIATTDTGRLKKPRPPPPPSSSPLYS